MKRAWLLIIGCLFIIIVILPTILWYTAPSEKIQIAIIDKTVPNESYREHNGITWLLNYLKYTNEADGAFQKSENYFGFVPNEKEESFAIRILPEDYARYDVIYLADMYGVYEEDLPWADSERDGARSTKIYGGLKPQEWDTIKDRLNKPKKSLLIAEYNAFAPPTEIDVMKSVTKYLGLEWSGWTGKYFDELNRDNNLEIPQWILDRFKDDWDYEGPGFILVNDLNYQVVVLEQDKHITKGGIHLSFTEEGQELFGIKDSPKYKNWFDIVTPRYGSTVLANYEWDLTEEGKEILKEKEIPTEFAAVIESKNGNSMSYYFAGDYNDIAEVPRFFQFKGLPFIYKFIQMFSDDAFYWSAYVPMVEGILKNFSELEEKREEASTELQYNARIFENKYEVLIGDTWTAIPIKGVNIGMGKPGAFPGEAAITEEEYYRWFKQIGEMNGNTVRVYTLHPPDFYQALKEYNDNHDEKLYVLHGVWINEEKLVEAGDAFEPENLKDFQEEMKTIVDVIHGNKIVEEKAGHASGVYRADISEYVIGWILGIEWDPFMVLNTNEKHEGIGDYEGTYFETKNANPFEYWLAEQMDIITKYEVENYNWIRPMSFTNWVTTDILDHPADSSGKEDIVSVDPNVIYTKNEMKLTGQFASYHIYPYYPDFLNYEESYRNYVDHRGEYNNYAAYLRDLNDAHRLPILVAEFGVPSSRGKTHENPFGWNQGFISEKEQGEILSRLYEDIMQEEMLGGLIFTWQDEWFKRTWNTMDYDNPNRRPFWSNAQTSEQQFGLLSFDRHKIQVDGLTSEWTGSPVYEKQNSSLRRLYVDQDERYLYIRLDYERKSKGSSIFLLDVVPGQGNYYIADQGKIKFSNGIDFMIDLRADKAQLLVDRYYDLFTYHYMFDLAMVESTLSQPTNNSGIFTSIHYALNAEYFIPNTGVTVPFSSYETGKLREGNGNPASPYYDSLADYYVNEDKGIIEVRIPWLLINAKDPSQKEFMGNMYENGLEASVFIEDIFIGALYVDEKGEVIDSFPSIDNNKLTSLKSYTWENWDAPLYEERLKQSYYIVKELFAGY